jgi:multimeric flavodoxin WrbA
VKSLFNHAEGEPIILNDDYMEALILDGTRKEDNITPNIIDSIKNILKERNYQFKVAPLQDQNISNCLGCFACWISTPGICIIDDAGRTIAEENVQSDLLILLTPIIFGGYSPELKKALDRMIPNMLPLYTKIGGEIHHSPRYEKYPKIVGIGFLKSPDQESENIFKKLIERNSINFFSEKYSALIIYSDDSSDDVKEKIFDAFVEVTG